MRVQHFRHLLLCAAATAVTACGGGGGGVGSTPFVPTPTPTPTPTPSCSSPPCFSAVDIFPNINSTTQFAVVGFGADSANATDLTSNGFSIKYDAGSGDYVMDFPSLEAGTFRTYTDNSPNSYWWGGAIRSSGTTVADASVLKPSNPDIEFTYTTLVGYNIYTIGEVPFGWAAFGTATPAGAVPTTGSATYTALVRGSSIDGWGEIGGSASLLFDFGAGKLSGEFHPVYYYLGGMGESYSLGTYTFQNTVFGVGSTSFAGQLHQPGVGGAGQFSGLFTGPSAQELMARWSAPFVDPLKGNTSTMFGVWVGKRR